MSAQKLREGGNTTAIVSGGRRKLHTTWDDGSELIEEYDAKTGTSANETARCMPAPPGIRQRSRAHGSSLAMESSPR